MPFALISCCFLQAAESVQKLLQPNVTPAGSNRIAVYHAMYMINSIVFRLEEAFGSSLP